MNKLVAQTTKILISQTHKLTFATKTPQKLSESQSSVTEKVPFDPMITVTKRKRKEPPIDPYKKKYFEKPTGTFQDFCFG
jgi:hypothetical protein